MRILTPVLYAGALAASIYAAIAQTSPLPPLPQATVAPAGETKLAYASPTDATPAKRATVRVGKRELCRQKIAARHLRRHEARDQLQLCVARARVECLEQAIKQKVRGPLRKTYVKSCVAA
ncbi:MAG: hypothetical protein ACTHM2_09220 [Afipia sp.]|jgi:hypothetical protein